jgi:uncharacterized zinc-type alcohol dehydrogenase-like protein
MIGSIAEKQEMLDFCGKHSAETETIPVNETHERAIRSDVRFRFVIDMAPI